MELSGTSASPGTYSPHLRRIRTELCQLIEKSSGCPPIPSKSKLNPKGPWELHRNISRFIEQRGPYGTQQGS
jgi:hypothetical protein